MVRPCLVAIQVCTIFLLLAVAMVPFPARGDSVQRSSGTCGLTYSMSPQGSGIPGQSVTIANTFSNAGSSDARIIVIVLDSQFERDGSSSQYGMLNSSIPGVIVTGAPPILVPAGSKIEHDMPLFVPDRAQPDDYNVTGSAWIECFNTSSSSWTAPQPSLATSTLVNVGYPPWVIASVIAVVGVAIAVLAAVVVRKVRGRPSHPPRQPVLPSWVPSD